MSATQQRQAAPGTTPIREVLGFEERLTALENENRELRQMIREQAICIGILNGTLANVRNCIRITAATDLALSRRLSQLECAQQGDLRLSAVLGGLEARLARVENGGEGLLP